MSCILTIWFPAFIFFKRVVPKGVTRRLVKSPSICMCVCGHVEFAPPPQTQHGENQPGSFSGHFEHFWFFGFVEFGGGQAPPTPPHPTPELNMGHYQKNFFFLKWETFQSLNVLR